MYGRYRRTTSEEELARLYRIPIPPQRDLPISWNIAPSQDVLVIRYNTKAKQRSLDALRWGLIPYWARIRRSLTRQSMPELKRSIPRPLTAKHSRNVAALFRLMAFMNGARLAAPRFPSRSG
jgi:putative SOS response-associated peptidase YedK